MYVGSLSINVHRAPTRSHGEHLPRPIRRRVDVIIKIRIFRGMFIILRMFRICLAHAL